MQCPKKPWIFGIFYVIFKTCSFDEFIDECDTDIHMITSLKKFLFDEMNKQKQFALKEDADDSKKKA